MRAHASHLFSKPDICGHDHTEDNAEIFCVVVVQVKEVEKLVEFLLHAIRVELRTTAEPVEGPNGFATGEWTNAALGHVVLLEWACGMLFFCADSLIVGLPHFVVGEFFSILPSTRSHSQARDVLTEMVRDAPIFCSGLACSLVVVLVSVG